MNKLFGTLLVLLLAMPAPAFAYLDPGTGSMLLQVILGGIAAVAVAIKLFWYRILAFLGLKKKAEAGAAAVEAETGNDTAQTQSTAESKDGDKPSSGDWD